MFNIRKRSSWNLSERLITPEPAFVKRREFLKQIGIGGAVAMAGLTGCGRSSSHAPVSRATDAAETNAAANARSPGASTGPVKYPAARKSEFNPNWRLTDEKTAARYNNFYEFTPVKSRVHDLTSKFVTSPWPIEIGGLVGKPMRLDVAELIDQMTLEERVYRFRCVEAWAMIVPWTGFTLRSLLERVAPKPEAKFLRFVTFNRPDQAPGMHDDAYPWPYTEGLRLDEAMNPLTLVATGIYGKPLPKQHGAPIRIVVPWKYGYKSIKSIVKVELVSDQPRTLWETLAPREYPFESNVDPTVDHPRWSQATERMIDTGDRVRTLAFNGYGEYVAKLYSKRPVG